MRSKLLLLVLLAPSLSSAERMKVEVDVKPKDCPSRIFHVQADDVLLCAEVSRADVLLAQRDFYIAAHEYYSRQVKALQQQIEAEKVGKRMSDAQSKAAEDCRRLGRSFDVVAAECGEVLKGGTEQ